MAEDGEEDGETVSTCRNCGMVFRNRMQMGGHMRSCGVLRSVPNVVAIPANVPVRPMTLHSLCRRPPAPWGREDVRPPAPRVVNEHDSPYVRDYRQASFKPK